MPTGTPTRIAGDLAQTQVGAAGTSTQVVGLTDFTIDWKAKTLDATTTDDAGHETYLGSTDNWTAKAKYIFIDGDTSQATNIIAPMSTKTGAVNWNFFPTVGTGFQSAYGKAYIDGVTMGSGVGKVVGFDVSLRGTGPLTFVAQTAPASGLGID
jgi:predicted secreted protein